MLTEDYHEAVGMSTGDIVSMTGFGSGKAESGDTVVRVTARSVNGRFLDVQIRCPNTIQEFEGAVRERVQQVLARGKVTIQIEVEESGKSGVEPVLDLSTAQRYISELKRLALEEGIQSEISLESLARLPGVFRVDAPAFDADFIVRLARAALDEALQQCDEMRKKEGETLGADMRQRVDILKQLQDDVEELTAACKDQYLNRLREKISALIDSAEIDEERLSMEVVMMAERSDITEEVIRFRSHTSQIIEPLDVGGEVGKRLNFLLQEMHREANTISSKATETEIVHQMLTAKEEIERLREQVQNLA